MNRINLTKYGFIRTPEEDFSDDGNRFQVYKVGNIRVSKLVADGQAYIHGRYEGPNQVLMYDEYSKLPHYLALDVLNGVSLSSITEQDLIDFFNTCVEHEKEFNEAANKVVLPTIEEMCNARKCVLDKRKAELKEITDIISADPLILTKLSDYHMTTVVRYLKSMNESASDDTFTASLRRTLGTSYSRTLLQDSVIANDLQPSYYYKACVGYLKNI